MPLEVGLLGATAVAVRAMIEPAAGQRVRAVAAGDTRRARAFAEEHGLRAADDYQALLQDAAIDTVYVSLHTSAHAIWAVRAARAGKRVIVEKPLCLSRRELHAIRAAGGQVSEAVMTAHAWQDALREMNLGPLIEARTHIVFRGEGFRRFPELGGGAFFDAAPYWLQALQATVGLTGAAATGESDFDGPNGIDQAFTARLEWPGGARATLEAAFGEAHRADHEFDFERATVRVGHFLRPSVAPFQVNLVIQARDGDRRVVAFPPVHYYTQQLVRLTRAWPPLDEAAERIGLMEDAYTDALKRSSV